MKQNQYEAILQCIKYGAPALANDLITAFQLMLQLANDQITAIQEKERLETEAELKKLQEEKAKQDSQNSKVVKGDK